MAEESARITPALGGIDNRPDPVIRITPPETSFDMMTILALFASVGLITGAIAMGNQNANFFDIPSVLIVILGTLTVTCTSYTIKEVAMAWPVIVGSIRRSGFAPSRVARELLDLAVVARRRGILPLANYNRELSAHPFLQQVVQMLSDGLPAVDIDRLIHHDIDVMLDGYKRAAGMLRRASEIAPAMGLIGTLIGLVQMLVALDDPSTIGPAMALALLTTFYGAIMGSVVLAPLAAKIERNANDDMLIKLLIHTAALNILAQGNPRKLELDLNAQLPPDARVQYFD
jgi:chemotaxis protein MotA